jgi:sugar/nucleoside kinase (ribokinase family)
VDVFLPNRKEAFQITGENNLEAAIRSLAAVGPLVVVKDGANGAYASQEDQILHVPAIPVTPVDTTGAGDCFSAGFTAAYLSGRSIVECLQWANIVGGLSTLKWGGTGQKVTCEEVEAWLDR